MRGTTEQPLLAPLLGGQAGWGAGRRTATGASLAAAAVSWAMLMAPLGALVAHLTPSTVERALSAPGALQPLVVSVEAGAASLVALVVVGTPLGWLLARTTGAVASVLEAGMLAMLLLPPLVIGLLLVFLVGPATPVGSLLAHVRLSASNTLLALVIAQSYEAGPYYVLGAQAAFRVVDPALPELAQLGGDSGWRSFRRVTVPLAAPGLVLALSTAWARAIGAFGAVLIVAYHPYGLPLQIFTTLEETGLASALPFAAVLVLVALPLPLAGYYWSSRAERRHRGVA